MAATKSKSISDREEKNKSVNEWQQKIANDYTYCMISTLNQMVNYLPMLLFDFEQPKMYITISNSKQNKEFDENIKKACGDFSDDCRFALPEKYIEIADLNSVSKIQEVLFEKTNGKKVLWNITGGQRLFVMAILELLKMEARKEDIVLYLEGNTGQLVLLEVKNSQLEKIEPNEHGFEGYDTTASNQEWLTIPIALKLMGFTNKVESVIKNKKGKDGEEEITDYRKFEPVESVSELYLGIVEKYKDNDSNNLQKKLLALNKKTKPLEENCNLWTQGELENKNDEEIKTYFELLTKEEIPLVQSHKSRSYPFGHLLEELFAHAIWDAAKDHIADMGVNIRLYYDDPGKHKEAGSKIVDELDIAVLTKKGQLVVFEVKSGEMHSDVAKSTKYTTYAIAGVYGKPVLLTPLLQEKLNNVSELRKCWAYGASASAVSAAQRAQLPVLALDGNGEDDFDTALKKILGI